MEHFQKQYLGVETMNGPPWSAAKLTEKSALKKLSFYCYQNVGNSFENTLLLGFCSSARSITGRRSIAAKLCDRECMSVITVNIDLHNRVQTT